MVSFYSNNAAVPKCPCNRASDDFGETEMLTSGVLQASVSDINLEPMLQDLPDELEGRVCCREDLLLQLRERRQWQVEHLSQRPVMYNVVVIKGMSLLMAFRPKEIELVVTSLTSFPPCRIVCRDSTTPPRAHSRRREGCDSIFKGFMAERSAGIHQTSRCQSSRRECLGMFSA